MPRMAPIALLLAACAFTPDRALWPEPWPAARNDGVETLAVERAGGWFSADKSVAIGPYTIRPVGAGWWDSVPGHGGFSIGLGGIAVGVDTVHDESEFGFRLQAQGADLAAVRCAQYLHIENWHGGVGDVNIGQVIIQGNLAYLATLNCRAVGFHPDWPEQWRLDLRAVDQRPFFGVLRVDGESWSVAGTQEAESGPYDASTGFELRDGEAILSRLNRIGEADLRLRGGLAAGRRMALLAAAGALLQANDPLSP